MYTVCAMYTTKLPRFVDKCADIGVEYFYDNTIYQEGVISPKIFIYFFINFDSNLTQTQMLTLKLFPNRTLTQTLT